MADHEDIARVLFVQQFGSGAPLMLIHGLMVTGEMFRPVIEPLSQYYRLIVPDLRGHGRSGHLPAPYTVVQLASDLAQVLVVLGPQPLDDPLVAPSPSNSRSTIRPASALLLWPVPTPTTCSPGGSVSRARCSPG